MSKVLRGDFRGMLWRGGRQELSFSWINGRVDSRDERMKVRSKRAVSVMEISRARDERREEWRFVIMVVDRDR